MTVNSWISRVSRETLEEFVNHSPAAAARDLPRGLSAYKPLLKYVDREASMY